MVKVSQCDLSASSLISFSDVTLVFLFVPRVSFRSQYLFSSFFTPFFFTTEFCHWNVKYFLRTSEEFFFFSLALLSLVTHCFTFWFHRHLHASSAIITCLRGVSGPHHHHHRRPLLLTLHTEPFSQTTAMSLPETRSQLASSAGPSETIRSPVCLGVWSVEVSLLVTTCKCFGELYTHKHTHDVTVSQLSMFGLGS